MTENTLVKQYEAMLARAKQALDLLTEADDNASKICNLNRINHRQASIMTGHFYQALLPLRELVEYLEKAVNTAGEG